MSTNYYFKIKNSETIKNEVRQLLKDKKLDFILGEKMLNDEGWVFNDEIHIGKYSGNWRPLFEKTEHYSSVKELLDFYENNKDRLIIVSEYGTVIEFEDLKSVLFTKEGKVHQSEEYFKIYFDDEGYQFGIGEFS